jgi:hypothetical protein
MGYIKHDTIIVTSADDDQIKNAYCTAEKLGLLVSDLSDRKTNWFRTFTVLPDGSKEGWEESDSFDEKRKVFLEYLNKMRYSDNSTSLHWVAVSFGSDDWGAEITSHAWQVPLISD